MSLYSKFKTDENLEVRGVELEYDDDVIIKIARSGGANKKYVKAMERLAKKRKVRASITNAEALKILREVFADTVVLSWENVKDEAGNEMACTKENIVKLFTDLPDLFADVREQAENSELYRAELIEDESGN